MQQMENVDPTSDTQKTPQNSSWGVSYEMSFESEWVIKFYDLSRTADSKVRVIQYLSRVFWRILTIS